MPSLEYLSWCCFICRFDANFIPSLEWDYFVWCCLIFVYLMPSLEYLGWCCFICQFDTSFIPSLEWDYLVWCCFICQPSSLEWAHLGSKDGIKIVSNWPKKQHKATNRITLVVSQLWVSSTVQQQSGHLVISIWIWKPHF